MAGQKPLMVGQKPPMAEQRPLAARRAQGGWLFQAACALAIAVVIGAYSDAFDNAFHFDDSHVVEGNLYIRSLKNVPLFFRDATTSSAHPPNAVYRPLMTTSLALDYWLGGGLQPRQFHLTQLTLLVVLGIMLFFLFLRLLDLAEVRSWNRWAALLAALLFCVHTTNTETMNIIAVRAELLSAIGVVGSFLVYFYMPGSRRTHLYLIPMVIGAFAKSPSVIFAPIFFVYLLLFEKRLSAPDLFTAKAWPKVRAAIWQSAPAFVVGVAAFLFMESMNGPAATYAGGDRISYLQTQSFVWLHYGRLFFLPVGLSADTDWGLIAKWYDTRVIAGLLYLAVLVRLMWVASKSAAFRPAAFGLAWFALALLPASSIFPLAEVLNEHRVFFPYMGLSLAVVWGLAALVEQSSVKQPGRRKLLATCATVLVLVAISGNAVGTYERNQTWHNGETLWRDVTEKSPGNGRGLMNYGLSQMAVGRFQEARDIFERAAVLTPNYGTLEINLGIVTGRLGDNAAAEAHFMNALRLQPNDPASHTFYSTWLVEHGRLEEAIPHLTQAIALSPADMGARYQLFNVYARTGHTAELKALATETLALVPGDAQAAKYAAASF